MSGLTTLRDDDGSATITTAGLIVALILVVLALTHGIRGTIASHHAKVVADRRLHGCRPLRHGRHRRPS